MDNHVMCANDTHTGEQGMRENRQRNTEQQPQVPTTTRNKNVEDGMLTRVKNIEKNINELMTYVEDIMQFNQINKDHQLKLFNAQEGLDKKIDDLNEKFDALENKLNSLEKRDGSFVIEKPT